MALLWQATACILPAAAAEFAAGQRWRYAHDGPRPGSMDAEPNAVGGERIVRVLSGDREQGAAAWVIEEHYTEGPEVVTWLHIDPEGLVAALEIRNPKGERVKLQYDPPVPYGPVDLQVGEVRVIQSTLRADSADFVLPNRITIERLADETVSTPAGEFPGCSYFQRTTTSTVDIRIAKISMTEERRQWYHPSVGGLVKEVYHRGPVRFLTWSRPGYTATSTLLAYDREETGSRDRLPPQADLEGGERRPRDPPPSRVGGRRFAGLILVGVAALLTGTLVMTRRARHGRGRRQ